MTSPPPLECVPLVLAARQSMERESRRSSSRDPESKARCCKHSTADMESNTYWSSIGISNHCSRSLENHGEGLRDGYEADTDTMPKRRGSVKQMAARSPFIVNPLVLTFIF